MSLPVGSALGPYRIVAPLGAGGMGEVFRARDTRLNRDVAIKVLLASVAADPDRLQRFQQEAQTLAALNHPNILAVHDFGVADSAQGGAPYLVSELLEGETLRERLNSGPLPVRRAVEYALGIVHGLSAGHGKGIIHRDIKPENIFITSDGRVKILDFGLAKLVQPDPQLATMSMTQTQAAGTTPGMVLGTVGYMSPEQVRGEPASAASDIFSFGAVFYEMLSGQRAFKRDTAAETMTAVLREEPAELAATGWHGPPGLQRIVERCLEKDPRRRFQSASDLAFAIESVSGVSAATGTAASGIVPVVLARKPWRLTWLAVPLAVLLAGWWFTHRPPAPRQPSFQQITFGEGLIPAARFTHDGQTVLFGAQLDDANMQIYSVRTTALLPVMINLPPAALLAVSPADIMAIATASHFGGHEIIGALADVSITGGTPRPIQARVESAAYFPDGKTLALSRLVDGKCVLEFPTGKRVHQTPGYLDYLRVSPDGQWLAFDEHPVPGDDRGWVAVVNRDGVVKRLTAESESAQGLAWTPDGSELWYTSANAGPGNEIWATTVGGKARKVYAAPSRLRLHDIAPDGRVLLETLHEKFEITGMAADGKVYPHLEMYGSSVPTDIARDGSAILMHEFGSGVSEYETAYRRLDGSPPLVLGPGAQPAFSPDGKRVAALLYSTPPQVVLYSLAGGEPRKIPLPALKAAQVLRWMPDGKHMMIGGAEADSIPRSYTLDLASGTLQVFAQGKLFPMAFSPDGSTMVAFGAGGAVLYDVATGKSQPIVGVDRKETVESFSEDGKQILIADSATSSSTVYLQDLASGKRTLLRKVEAPDKAGAWESFLQTTRDGKAYAYFQASTHSTLYIVEGLR